MKEMTGKRMSVQNTLLKHRDRKRRQNTSLLQNLKDKEAHPFLGIDVYLGIKELITVIIFP